MYITTIIRVILVFMLIFFVFFVFLSQLLTSTQQPDNDNLEDMVNGCSQASMSNCQHFYSCLGILSSCRAQDRFDSNVTRQCQNYYLTDCGDRYNPPFPTISELCTPFWNNQSTQHVFPTTICSRYLMCDTITNVTQNQICPDGTLFSIPDMTCLPELEVDCGKRIV
ncbi:hypothetical protein [Psilogramma increta granulovirus]|uniref:Chitin-binding type-2 domain-containing protein n=1 Tax=Psilogramma increta granulovirus TaxID=2953508 RepID=A0A977TNR4_9BBAC|nr:hypothetical protein [Psilogramma increta granulovirus]